MSIQIIDPFYKGSRKYITDLFIEHFILLGKQVELIRSTNEDFDTTDGVHSVRSFKLSEKKWYYRLNNKDIANLTKLVSINGGNLFINGINELFKFKFLLFLFNFKGYKFVIDYNYNIDESLFKRQIKRYLYKILSINVVALDERLLDINANIFWFPDIQPGEFNPKPFNNNEIKHLALIGKQNERKGIDNFISVLVSPESSNYKFSIFGKIENKNYENIIKKLPNVDYYTEYLTDAELNQKLNYVDVIVLPYSNTFIGSSGVLATAMKKKIPVLATAHGLVGYRVKRHRVGLTFQYNELPRSFFDCIEKFRLSDHYDAIELFNEEFSAIKFKKKTKELIEHFNN